MRIAHAAFLAVSTWCATGGTLVLPAQAAMPDEWMVELTVQGQKVEGTPLAWNARQVRLLGRDGRLWVFDPRQAADFRTTASRFSSYSTSQLRAILLRAMGEQYEVTGSSHYLVAHPRGQRDKWAERFEDLYRSFVHYFSVRGFQPAEPPFPLLGIVCKDQADFSRYAAQQRETGGTNAKRWSAGVMGIYGLISNRIILYDMQADEDSPQWRENAAVVIHEATHQTAFNTGVHSRYAPPPLWVAEGLATMFEAPGVYDPRHFTRQIDRVNRGRLLEFKRAVQPGHRPESLEAMIASDLPFQTDPAEAYAAAWALSFYLVESQLAEYARYLALTAGRPPFTEYTAAQRTGDFQSVFGRDWRMLEAQFRRFMAAVK